MNFEVRDGRFSYGGDDLLSGVNFSLCGREIMSVLGANGAGKTTLLKCALGLRRWSGGRSYINGEDISRLPWGEVWRHVGYVPQARPSSFAYTVREMVMLGRGSRIGCFSTPGVEDEEKTDEAMELAGISGIAGKPCGRISGGEFQLVLIARALAAEPSMLVLDEPESNLDFRNQRRVLRTVSRLCAERGMSALFSTHYPEHAAETSHKALLLMPGGRSVAGPSNSVITEENLSAAFGIPVCIHRFCAWGESRVGIAAGDAE